MIKTVKLSIQIESSDDVFQTDEDTIRATITWALEETITKIKVGARKSSIRDINGNVIGNLVLEIESED